MMPTAMANGRDGGDGARGEQQLFREERRLPWKEQLNSSLEVAGTQGGEPRLRHLAAESFLLTHWFV